MKITLSDMCRGAGFERMRTKTFWAFCHRPFSCAQKKITSRLIGYKYYDGDRNTQIRLSVRTMRESFEKPLGTKSAFAIGNVTQVKKTSQACALACVSFTSRNLKIQVIPQFASCFGTT